MPRAFLNDSFNDIHELKCGQAEEKLEAGGDEKLIFNFIWPQLLSESLESHVEHHVWGWLKAMDNINI